MSLTRRQFIHAAGAAGATVATAGWAGAGCAALPRSGPAVAAALPGHRLTRYPLAFGATRPRPLRVVHITDLHVGMGTPTERLWQAVASVRQAAPDLVVLTGDYLNHTLTHLERLRRLVAALPRPCVATLGNHDHWSGAEAITDALESVGARVLANQSTVISTKAGDVPVVGIDDGYTEHEDVDRAFAGVARPEDALVLSHFPETADAIAARGGRLILSGHTHGGHVNVRGVSPIVYRGAGLRYVSGWYTVGDARLYVNAGLGTSWFRLRAGPGTAPEVAIFDLAAPRSPPSGRIPAAGPSRGGRDTSSG